MRSQQPSRSDSTELRPFRVEISDAAIEDLRGRLARTRWPEKEPVGDWSMGIPLTYVQELAGHWEKCHRARYQTADARLRSHRLARRSAGVDRREVQDLVRLRRRPQELLHQRRAARQRHGLLAERGGGLLRPP